MCQWSVHAAPSYTFLQCVCSAFINYFIFPYHFHVIEVPHKNFNYRKTSSISRTKSQSLNESCILAQLSLLNPLNPGVKLRMKM